MTRSLPYFDGTPDQFRDLIAGHAEAAHRRYVHLTALVGRRGHGEATTTAYRAALYGFGVVALLGWIKEKVGPDGMREAAAIIDDMAINGGVPFYDDEETR